MGDGEPKYLGDLLYPQITDEELYGNHAAYMRRVRAALNDVKFDILSALKGRDSNINTVCQTARSYNGSVKSRCPYSGTG